MCLMELIVYLIIPLSFSYFLLLFFAPLEWRIGSSASSNHLLFVEFGSHTVVARCRSCMIVGAQKNLRLSHTRTEELVQYYFESTNLKVRNLGDERMKLGRWETIREIGDRAWLYWRWSQGLLVSLRMNDSFFFFISMNGWFCYWVVEMDMWMVKEWTKMEIKIKQDFIYISFLITFWILMNSVLQFLF